MKAMVLICAVAASAIAATRVDQYNTHDFSFPAQYTGNPFDVELAADFTGPDGSVLKVPGFYDGNGVWKIRFCPTVTGQWSMRTISTLHALDGKSESGIECEPNTHPQIHGGLRVDPEHPHHFRGPSTSRF